MTHSCCLPCRTILQAHGGHELELGEDAVEVGSGSAMWIGKGACQGKLTLPERPFEQRSSGMGFWGEHMQKTRVCLGTCAWWVTTWCLGWDAGTVLGDWRMKDFGSPALVIVSV